MSEQVLKSQLCSVLQEYPTAPTDLPAGLVGLTVMPIVLVGQQLINEHVRPAGSVGPAMHFGQEWVVTGPRSLPALGLLLVSPGKATRRRIFLKRGPQ
ncbi:hypothetical protein Tco_0104118 [Tanacetum coccineum]